MASKNTPTNKAPGKKPNPADQPQSGTPEPSAGTGSDPRQNEQGQVSKEEFQKIVREAFQKEGLEVFDSNSGDKPRPGQMTVTFIPHPPARPQAPQPAKQLPEDDLDDIIPGYSEPAGPPRNQPLKLHEPSLKLLLTPHELSVGRARKVRTSPPPRPLGKNGKPRPWPANRMYLIINLEQLIPPTGQRRMLFRDPEGLHALAGRYGAREDADPRVLLECYRQAAEQGYAPAQTELAQCYLNGRGVEPDRESALKWYRLAAAQGHSSALSMLNELDPGSAPAPRSGEAKPTSPRKLVQPAKPKAVTKKRARELLSEARSLSELKDILAQLEDEAGKPLSFRGESPKPPLFGGPLPKHAYSVFTQTAFDLGLFRRGRWLQYPQLISWDPASVLVRGARGLLLLERQSFEECFSGIVCPFCGERFVYGFECRHFLAVNDRYVEYWTHQSVKDIYLAYLADHKLWWGFREHVPNALPGAVVESCEVQGRAYRGRTTLYQVCFAPDALLKTLRQSDKKQWDEDLRFEMGCRNSNRRSAERARGL